MANFDRTWPDTYVAGMPVTADELKSVDRNVCKTINAEDGSVHAPTSPIEIGGAGCKITSVLIVSGTCGIIDADIDTLTVGGSATIASLVVTNTTQVQTLVAQNDVAFGNNLEVDGDCDVGGYLSVDGPTNLFGTLAVGGQCAFSADVTFNAATYLHGTTVMNGNVSLTKPITPSAAGRLRKRVINVAADGNQNYNANQVDIVRIPNGLLTANRVYYLQSTGATEGDEITVVTEDVTYAVNVTDADSGSVVGSIKLAAATGWSVRAVYTAGRWRRIAMTFLPA